MNETEIKNIIYQTLEKIAPDTEPEQLKPDDNIRTGLEIDSFDHLQFIVAIGEKFSIDIPEADYGKIQTMSTLIAYLQQKSKMVYNKN